MVAGAHVTRSEEEAGDERVKEVSSLRAETGEQIDSKGARECALAVVA
jgi:hypothetical protein